MDTSLQADANSEQPDWLHAHAHESNPTPPSADPTLTLLLPGQAAARLTVAALRLLPATTLEDCWITSTGHPASGPFTFDGVTLHDLIRRHLPTGRDWRHADVVSADGFGNRVLAEEAATDSASHPILLAYRIDGRSMTRAEGLVRLIVPSETEDALRQVKWIAEIRVE